ncbi:MAG: hypothetical protein INR73_03025 [Williamsia sp.]|nr:hypothetical protein [Williamsia sp.]
MILLSEYKNKLPILIIGILLVLLVNSFSPLRLTNDTVDYFTQMEKLDKSLPTQLDKQRNNFPYGYVIFLFVLKKLGVLTYNTIVIIQFCYLLGVLYLSSRIFKGHVNIYLFAILFICSWLTMKFTLFPLSEMQYLFASLGALYFYQRFEDSRNLWAGLITFFFCLVAIFTRTVGIALIPALGLAFFFRNRKNIRHWRPGERTLAILICSSLLVLLVIIVFTSPYFGSLWQQFRSEPLSYICNTLGRHLTDWGEVFINFPMVKIIGYVSFNLGRLVYVAVGCVSLIIVFYTLFVRKVLNSLHIEIYFVLYVIGIFGSASFDSRFWFPVLPFLLFILMRSKIPEFVLYAYRAVYILTGLFALGYYTFLSFNKDVFASKHDAGIWRAEYETLFYGRSSIGDTTSMNDNAIYILRKYD